MAKPIIKAMSAPNAASGFSVNFLWNGDRAYYNRLILTNNETNEVVYDKKIETFNLFHTVAANALSNGGMWIAQVSVFYKDPSDTSKYIESELSDKYIFPTFSTPIFKFADLDVDADNKVTSSSYQAQIYYNSAEKEQIESYMFSLYDVSKKFLFETDRLTDAENITYTYRGLDNLTEYYVRCRAVTRYGIELDTGLIKIHIKHQGNGKYSRISGTPLSHRGCIEIGSNLIVIQYNGDEKFKYNGSQIILDEQTLYYDENWTLKDDFTVIVRLQFMQYGQLLKLTNGIDEITLTSRAYADAKTRFKLKATNGFNNYILYSTPQDIGYEDKVVIGVHKKNDVFGIKVYTDNSESTGNYWWGIDEPSTAEEYANWVDVDETPTVEKLYEDIVETIENTTEPENAALNDIWISPAN